MSQQEQMMTGEQGKGLADRKRRARRPRYSPLAVVWVSFWMLVAAGCFWGWLRDPGDGEPQANAVQAKAVADLQVNSVPLAAPAAPPQAPAPVPLTTMPIEQVRVGQKVPAHNPDRSQVETDTPEVDPPTWRLVTMRQTTCTDSGGVDVLNIQTIQPLSLIEATGARPGAMVPVPLDVQEMADVPGPAEVLSIEPCPPIQPGPGQLVLTTVNHLNNFLFDLTVKDAVGKQETISPTGWHKFFSQTRKAWVSACELKEGEKLAGHDGDLTVTGLAREPGVHRVYNMTVQGEHVYYVAQLGLLAHNDCGDELLEESLLYDHYINGSGGRWGGASTRQLNDGIASTLEELGADVTNGAGRDSEEWISPLQSGTENGTFVDITATFPDGQTVRVQTVSTLPDGSLTATEEAAAARIEAAFPNDILFLIDKIP